MNDLTKLLLVLAMFAGVVQAQEPKDQASSGQSVAPLFGVGGGPDAFGYTFTDSSAGNCAFQFIDISATGAQVVSGDDVGSTPITLQGPFNFYGDDLTDIVMTSNGYLSTDPTDTGPDLSNDCPLPVTPSTGGGARIYPLHDDLITNNGLFEYFPVCPRPSDQFPGADLGCHVFHYDEATHFGDTVAFDTQVILYDNSFEIVFQHDDRNPEAGSGSTTGIQNAAADIGLTFACDAAASIPANSAQCFIHPTPDVAVLPPPPAVPTMTTWGMIAMALALMVLGSLIMRRRAN